jgi:hypothetical protein
MAEPPFLPGNNYIIKYVFKDVIKDVFKDVIKDVIIISTAHQ